MNRETKQAEIDAKKAEIREKEKEIDDFELDPDDFEDLYRDSINEEGDVIIGTLSYNRAMVLEEIDPIAYWSGLNDFVDSLSKEESEDYRELQAELETLEDELSDLETELEEIDEEEDAARNK